jgi:hypothetical protein
MFKSFLLVSFIGTLLIGCKKNQNPINHEISDARKILVKEVEVSALPSPFFHFEYDAQNFVTAIHFANDIKTYHPIYQNKRVIRVNKINTSGFNDGYMLYTYNNQNVIAIDEYNKHSQKFLKHELSYNNARQLTQIIWKNYTSTSENLYKKIDFDYWEDGNLKNASTYLNNGTELEFMYKDSYSQYDNKECVDDFYLYKQFMESVIFLPQVKLQKNNAHRLETTTPAYTNRVDWQFDFSGNLPIKKTGSMYQIAGPNVGNTPATFYTTFSYY